MAAVWVLRVRVGQCCRSRFGGFPRCGRGQVDAERPAARLVGRTSLRPSPNGGRAVASA